jgi:hypothetical protein
MPDLMSALVTLVAMLGVFAIIVRGARPSRKGANGPVVLHARSFGFLRRYRDDSLWAAVIIGAIAVGELLPVAASPAAVGAGLGLMAAVLTLVGMSTVRDLGLAVVGLAATLAVIVDYFGSEGHAGPLGTAYRAALLGLLTVSYAGGAVLAGPRKLLSPRRVLIYFGLVEVISFLASPLGAQTLDLAPQGHALYLLVTAVTAFVLGWLQVDIVVALMAAGTSIAGVLMPGTPQQEPLVLVVSAVAVTALVMMMARPLRRSPA